MGNAIASRVLFQPPPVGSYNINTQFHNGRLRLIEGTTHEIPLLEVNVAPPFSPLTSRHRKVVLYHHGNACDLKDVYGLLATISQDLQCPTFSFDYPCYGICHARDDKSTSTSSSLSSSFPPTEQEIRDAATDVLKWILRHRAPDEIILWGESLGCFSALHNATVLPTLCNEDAIHGKLVLYAPFASVRSFVPLSLGRLVLWSEMFDNVAMASECRLPVVIVHGENDEVIAQWQGRRVYDAIPHARKAFMSLPEATHNTLWIFVMPRCVLRRMK
jgi:pimeloyl-ACP methyl ester carboxylesterase